MKPPFGLRVRGANCVLQLGTGGDKTPDEFSWRDVRSVATNIIEDCQPPRGSGKGGSAHVGPKELFVVAIIGVKPLGENGDFEPCGIPFSNDTVMYPLLESPTEVLNNVGENSTLGVGSVGTSK